ncbi:MAG: mammalian cell entry protein [Mycobacterium sp.]
MEDQRTRPGDLTDEAPDEVGADTDAEADLEDGDVETADASLEDGDAETAEEATTAGLTGEDAVAAPPRRRWRLRPAAVAAVAAALFVGSAAFAGAAVQPYLADRAVVATKVEIVRTAVKAIGALWNYTPENLATLVDRASVYLSGDLEADYRKFIDAIVTANQQGKVTDSTEIVGAAVESLDGSEATVLIYTNTAATSELTRSIPALKYQSSRLFMRRDNNRWVITRMPTITSLNLTPQL